MFSVQELGPPAVVRQVKCDGVFGFDEKGGGETRGLGDVAQDGAVHGEQDGHAQDVVTQRVGEHTVVDEDVVPRRTLNTPYQPSQSEIDDHMVDHIPYRHWCRCCLEGFGREASHDRVHGERLIPVVAFDYLFITRRGVVGRQELVDGEEDDPTVLKVIAIRDSASKAITAHAVPRKGVDSQRFSVSCVVDFILWLGYCRVILMSDNEARIVFLFRRRSRR